MVRSQYIHVFRPESRRTSGFARAGLEAKKGNDTTTKVISGACLSTSTKNRTEEIDSCPRAPSFLKEIKEHAESVKKKKKDGRSMRSLASGMQTRHQPHFLMAELGQQCVTSED